MASSSSNEHVTLVSSDGFEFVIPRSTACVSGTIRRMLDPSSESLALQRNTRAKLRANPFTLTLGKFSEAITGVCVLENITLVNLLNFEEFLPQICDLTLYIITAASSSRKSVNIYATTRK